MRGSTTAGGRWQPYYLADSAQEASSAAAAGAAGSSSSSLCCWLPALSTRVPATSATCVVCHPSYIDVTATHLLSSTHAGPGLLKPATAAAAAASEYLGKRIDLNDAG